MIDNLILTVADIQVRDQSLIQRIAPAAVPAPRNIVTAIAAVLTPFFRATNPALHLARVPDKGTADIDDLRPRRVADGAAPFSSSSSDDSSNSSRSRSCSRSESHQLRQMMKPQGLFRHSYPVRTVFMRTDFRENSIL